MRKLLIGISELKTYLLPALLFSFIIGAHHVSLAELIIHEPAAQIQYGDPGPPPVPDTPEAPGPGEIEDPALSGDTVLGAPDPALGNESVVSEPDPVVEEPAPLVEQAEPLVEQPEALVEQGEPMVEQPEVLVPQGEPLVEQPEPLVPQGEPLGDREAEGRGIR